MLLGRIFYFIMRTFKSKRLIFSLSFLLILFLGSLFLYKKHFFSKSPIASVSAQTTQTSWYMAGANPQRTSWVPEQVPATNNRQWGSLNLYPQWYKRIEPYIPHRIQPVLNYGILYVASARGLYAVDANNGDLIDLKSPGLYFP